MNLWQKYTPELVTDLYEFTMAESYLREGMDAPATFSLFIRSYPRDRAYFVSAGLEHLLELIPRFRFGEESLEYLASLGKFSSSFLHYLENFRFTGTVRAIPEGRLFFTQEPLLEVTAPIIEAQLIETLVINVLQMETLIASKAARCVQAARGRSLIDFSLRRTHGVDAGVKVARASYLAGFDGTSNVLAGKLFHIPVVGTMAHSYIISFPSELDSFYAFERAFPRSTVLLIDTYDTVHGAEKALQVARKMREKGLDLQGVRLDSGDMVQLSREVREIFHQGGFPDVKILVSGSLDEYTIEEMLNAGAEVDVFAVGTRMGVSADAPYFDIAYKLVEYDDRPVLKLSSGKKTWVGRKQVYRNLDEKGRMKGDTVALLQEEPPEGQPLLETVMEGGKPLRQAESLKTVRERFQREWASLPQALRQTRPQSSYPVRISASLQQLEEKTAQEKKRTELAPLP